MKDFYSGLFTEEEDVSPWKILKKEDFYFGGFPKKIEAFLSGGLLIFKKR